MKKKLNHTAVLILAAGSSSRLGRPKQLLKFNEKTLLQKAIESALEVTQKVIVVLGANDRLIRPTIEAYPVEVVWNENWAEGMSGSIRTGMLPIIESDAQEVLIMLTDQPFVDVFLLKKLIAVFKESDRPIVASKYENKVGVPAIFDVSFFPKLKNLTGQKGAKALIMSHLDEVETVVFDKGKIDIDTEEDWERFREGL